MVPEPCRRAGETLPCCQHERYATTTRTCYGRAFRDLLKTTFLLVQTLNQVQGDGGIEVPEPCRRGGETLPCCQHERYATTSRTCYGRAFWDLLKTTFLLVQTLNQVQGDGGIEASEFAEGWSLSLVEGRVLRAGSTPDYFFCYNFIDCFRICFVCYGFKF